MSTSIVRNKFTVVMTDANTAYPLAQFKKNTSDFEVYVPSGNGGANVYIGNSSVNTGWIPRASGSTINYVSGNGNMTGRNAPLGFDLSKWYVMGVSAGDTIIVEFTDFE